MNEVLRGGGGGVILKSVHGETGSEQALKRLSLSHNAFRKRVILTVSFPSLTAKVKMKGRNFSRLCNPTQIKIIVRLAQNIYAPESRLFDHSYFLSCFLSRLHLLHPQHIVSWINQTAAQISKSEHNKSLCRLL